MGGVVRVAFEGVLVREACSLISSLWSAVKCPVMSYEMSVVLE